MTELQKEVLIILSKEMEKVGGKKGSYDMKELLLVLSPGYNEIRKLEIQAELETFKIYSGVVLIVVSLFFLFSRFLVLQS